jgi:hypothetical protein
MHHLNLISTTSLLIASFVAAATCSPPSTTGVAGTSHFGVFVGTSPCGNTPRPLLKIPLEANCDRIKWSLALYRDPNTDKPTTYTLNGEWGFHIDNRTYLTKGTLNGMEGNRAIARGTKTDPDAIIIQLDADKPHLTISFVAMDANILHLLDRDKNLMVGDGGQSYTLSRTEKATRPIDSRPSSSIVPTSATNRSSVVGVFQGRTPCRDIARERNRVPADDCAKIKWQLTLYQDPKTLTPTTFKLKTTFNREFAWEGNWAILRGTKTNPAAVVYQLDPDKPQSFLLLLKADDNILFFMDKERKLLQGNSDFSYTLNRSA